LYHRAVPGWPTLHIVGGSLVLDSTIAAPLGVGFIIDVAQLPTATTWKAQHSILHSAF
jgi:hypothetical protein